MIESSTTRIRLGPRVSCARRSRRDSFLIRRPPSRLSIERIRSSTSMISTGQPFSSTDELFRLGTFPSRGSSGVTRRSRSPRNRSIDDPEPMAAVAGDDYRHPAVLPGRRRKLQHLGRLDQAQRLIVQDHVGLPLQVDDVLTIEHQDAVDPVERECEWLAGNLHEQGPG